MVNKIKMVKCKTIKVTIKRRKRILILDQEKKKKKQPYIIRKSWSIKGKIDKLDFNKVKIFFFMKNTTKEKKLHIRREYLKNHIS